MYRRALQTLFVAATLLLSTTACDKGGDTKSAAKDGAKKTDDSGKVETDKADEGGAAESVTPPEPVKTDEGGAAAEAGAPAEEGGEVAADSAAAAEAGEPDGAEAGEKDPPKDPAKDPVKEPKDGGDKEKDPPKDGGDVSAKVDAKSIFDGKCKSCHGADGKGDTTIGKKVNIPSLSGTSMSKAKIVSTIENGVPDTKMKAYKDKLSKDEINAVADYVKKL